MKIQCSRAGTQWLYTNLLVCSVSKVYCYNLQHNGNKGAKWYLRSVIKGDSGRKGYNAGLAACGPTQCIHTHLIFQYLQIANVADRLLSSVTNSQ